MSLRFISRIIGTCVGKDEFGNRYYQTRRCLSWFLGKSSVAPFLKRWVVFAGMPEASKVPAHWHGWLHYTISTPPTTNDPHYSWQQTHIPNLTGTPLAHHPPGHILEANPKRYQDYQAWKPNEEKK